MNLLNRGAAGLCRLVVTGFFCLLILFGVTACAAWRGGGGTATPDSLGGKRLVYLQVGSEEQPDRNNRLIREVLVGDLQSRVSDVLVNLGFRPRTRYTGQNLSLGVHVNRVSFQEKSVFGNVQMVIDHEAQCVSPGTNYRQSYTYTQTIPPDKVQEARENAAAVIEEQYQRAVPEIVRNLFNDQQLVDCLVRHGARTNPFKYEGSTGSRPTPPPRGY